MTYPLEGIPLSEHASVLKTAEDLGYTDAWTAEVNANDAFTPTDFASNLAALVECGRAKRDDRHHVRCSDPRVDAPVLAKVDSLHG